MKRVRKFNESITDDQMITSIKDSLIDIEDNIQNRGSIEVKKLEDISTRTGKDTYSITVTMKVGGLPINGSHSIHFDTVVILYEELKKSLNRISHLYEYACVNQRTAYGGIQIIVHLIK